jgi:hypothetical protein
MPDLHRMLKCTCKVLIFPSYLVCAPFASILQSFSVALLDYSYARGKGKSQNARLIPDSLIVEEVVLASILTINIIRWMKIEQVQMVSCSPMWLVWYFRRKFPLVANPKTRRRSHYFEGFKPL